LKINDVSGQKNDLRRHMKALRDGLSDDFRRKAAGKIAGFADMLPITPDDCVAVYFPVRSECDVMPLAARLRQKGCRLALPVVEKKGAPLVFRRFDAVTRFKKGLFGIDEPDETAVAETPAVFLTPLLAFDRKGGRLGYGAGCYDRTFPLFPSALLIGVAFSKQEIPDVPVEKKDVLLDYVLTENELIKVG